MGRAPCCDKANVKRGPWSPDEDATLKTFLETHGTGGNWIALPKKAGLRRCGKSCRLRWLNYLRPNIKHGGFTEEEDNIICTLYTQMGSRWSAIASQLPGRTDNDVKNYWNTKLKKKLMAGKVSLKTKLAEESDTLFIPSITPLLLTKNSDFPASQNQNQNPPPLSNDAASSSFNINENGMNFGLMHQMYTPQQQAMDASASESGAYSRNINNNSMVSLSQEGSSISDSSSITLDYNNKCVMMPEHASDESKEVLMEFGFGLFPNYDFVNGGLNCHERVGEFAPSYCYPELVDFSYVDIKPQL